ncbi:MAG: hypothetical protein Q8P50_08575 [Bacillota bacterium]|nr:hypothetical protein [Bacillota bacterium]
MTPPLVGRALRVAQNITIRKTRRFPLSGEALVRVGDQVTPDTVLGLESSEEKLHLMKLDVSDQRLISVVMRQQGDTVKMGETIALNTYAMGLGLTEYCSPVDGVICGIDTRTGLVQIREHPAPLKALLPGRVASVSSNESVVIETQGAYIEGAYGDGQTCGGRIAIVAKSPGSRINPAEITSALEGKIAVIGAECRHEHLMAGLRSRAAGIIAGGGDLDAIQSFFEFAANLTKEEYDARFGSSRDVRTVWEQDDYTPGLGVMLTEGFGQLPVRTVVFELLASLEGLYAFLDIPGKYSEYGEPPQLIIPRAVIAAPASSGPDAPRLEQDAGLRIEAGSRVRFVGGSRLGQTGIVHSAIASRLTLVTGQSVPAVEILFDDGSTATVPRSNVEAIQQS